MLVPVHQTTFHHIPENHNLIYTTVHNSDCVQLQDILQPLMYCPCMICHCIRESLIVLSCLVC